MKKIVVLTFTLACIFAHPVFSQTFEEYLRQEKEREKQYLESKKADFEKYKRERQQEISNMLKEKWEAMEILSGKKRPSMPAPEEAPIAKQDEPIININTDYEIKNIDNIPKLNIEVIDIPAIDRNMTPPENKFQPKEKNMKTSFKFCNYTVTEFYNNDFIFKLNNVSENAIGEFWSKLSNTEYYNLIEKYLESQEFLSLNDWAYYKYISSLADNIYPESYSNEKIIFTAFILNCSGYDVQLAMDINKTRLFMMMSVTNSVFEVPYWMINGKKYIIPDKKDVSNIYICKKFNEIAGSTKSFNLVISEPLFHNYIVRDAGQIKSCDLESNIFSDKKETVYFNNNLFNFYDKYPACDFDVYFNSLPSMELIVSLDNIFKKTLKGKTETQKVAELLQFMHESLEYQTDDEQFGREKYFFVEELFMYKYNDCEDRSVLFSYLVRRYTGLKVIGIIYDDHVATGVKFNEDIQGNYISYNGEKYLVCDPTYIGAKIGQAMPQYNNQSVEIIETVPIVGN